MSSDSWVSGQQAGSPYRLLISSLTLFSWCMFPISILSRWHLYPFVDKQMSSVSWVGVIVPPLIYLFNISYHCSTSANDCRLHCPGTGLHSDDGRIIPQAYWECARWYFKSTVDPEMRDIEKHPHVEVGWVWQIVRCVITFYHYISD